MSEKVIEYIKSHEYIYRLLREDSSFYERLFQDEDYIYELDKIAKERYHLRYTDKLDKMSNKFNLIGEILDIFK